MKQKIKKTNNDELPYRMKDGDRYYRVTSLISILNRPELNELRGFKGNKEMDRIMNETATIGRIFHDQAVQMVELREHYEYLINTTYDDILEPMCKKYLEFILENVVKAKCHEKTMFSKKFGYCGRIDDLYLFKNRKTYDLIDIKTSKIRHYSHALQLSAYKNLLKEHGIECSNRYIISVPRDGSPVKMYKITTDHNIDFYNFLHCKTLFIAVNN